MDLIRRHKQFMSQYRRGMDLLNSSLQILEGYESLDVDEVRGQISMAKIAKDTMDKGIKGIFHTLNEMKAKGIIEIRPEMIDKSDFNEAA